MATDTKTRFISTNAFDKKWRKRVGDDERSTFEKALAENPTMGDVIAHTGGARKVRWARPGGGKSGGVRVIYYYRDSAGTIWLLGIYAKNEKDNLSDDEVKTLAKMIKELKE